MKVNTTERGYAGHLCVSSNCNFRRNTLIEYGDKRIVVSTVGNYNHRDKIEEIGCSRYYETMAFKAIYQDPYWEADTSNEIEFDSKWSIDVIERETDKEADQLHEAVVKELKTKIKTL